MLTRSILDSETKDAPLSTVVPTVALLYISRSYYYSGVDTTLLCTFPLPLLPAVPEAEKLEFYFSTRNWSTMVGF
jgi:hypothetical protein